LKIELRQNLMHCPVVHPKIETVDATHFPWQAALAAPK
jgi:hypothetical protein